MSVAELNKRMAAGAAEHLSNVLETQGADALTTEWLAFKDAYSLGGGVVHEVEKYAEANAPELAAALNGGAKLEDILDSVESAVELSDRSAKEFLFESLGALSGLGESGVSEMISWLANHDTIAVHPKVEADPASNSVKLTMRLAVSWPAATVLTAHFEITDPDLEKDGAVVLSSMDMDGRAAQALAAGEILRAE